jgi:amino acid adenylation domain-containing protein/non-ribosomal peptide synthase protein (TIGR01720 family)
MSISQVNEPLEGIAIVGMSGRFPGARNIAEFWENLRNGVESISFFSEQELRNEGIDKAVLSNPNYVRAKGVLEGIDLFDAAFFGFSPREAEIMDPQQRLFLECAWEALEDAGYNADAYPGLIGVYAGVGMNTYFLFNLYSNPDLVESIGVYQTIISNDKDFLSTRVSYKLNLRGPSVSLQTACSTSLVAVYMACQSLLSYQCDMALAGGVTLSVPNKSGYFYEPGGINSPDGHCRAFDARAQGTVGGNGVATVVLKRLADAIEDGDTVHAIIKGSAINNDGSQKVGYTAPSVDSQAEVISLAQAIAGVEPDTIGYIEAHGTATPLGDPIEVAALTKVFNSRTDRKRFCAIGSVKTNIGHLDTAAGIAGLIKTVLMLKHKLLLPSLHFEQANPKLDLDDSAFYVNTSLREWQQGSTPRRAGVSSFGIGGTNAHVILEEAPLARSYEQSRLAHLLVLSAKSDLALERATYNLLDYLKLHNDVNLADVAYTLQVGRKDFNYKRMLVCRDRDDALAALEATDPKRVLTDFQEQRKRSVVFMFSGQGAQYVNMARELYEQEPVFRQQVDECSNILERHLGLDLRSILYPTEELTAEASDRLNQTAITQPALFVIEYALAKLWMTWGIRPQAMIGHSIGEYVAACLAGVLSLKDGLALVAERARLMQQMPAGKMMAVPLSEEELRPLLDNDLSLAAVNAPSLCVVSGPVEAINRLWAHLAGRGLDCQPLHTSHAFHSKMMNPVLGVFSGCVERLRLNPPQIPFISNLTGTWITEAEATSPDYWAKQLRNTVRFSDGIRELLKRDDLILLEIGPGHTLTTLARLHTQTNAQYTAISSLRHPHEKQSDEAFLLASLGRIWLAGERIDWPLFHSGQRRRRVPLTTYPFERRRYWIEPQREIHQTNSRAAALSKKPDVADWFYLPSWKRATFTRSLSNRNSAEARSRFLVFVDECGFGLQIINSLRQQAEQLVSVKAGEGFDRIDESSYAINPEQQQDYERLIKELQAQDKLPDKIINFWGIMPNHQPGFNIETFNNYQSSGFFSLLYLTQALGKQNISLPLETLVITNSVYDVTGEERLDPRQAIMLGPCKVIPQEYPNITCRSIDIAVPETGILPHDKLVDLVVEEIVAGAPDRVVAYRGAHRWTQIFDPVRLDGDFDISTRLREGGVYVITGGLGNIGLLLAEYIARTMKAKLALIARSQIPEKQDWQQWLLGHDEDEQTSRKIRKLQSIEESGGEVLVLCADVADISKMREVLAQTRQRFGRIHGLIHAAGIVGDASMRAIQETSKIACEEQFRAKVYGLMVLDELLQAEDLDFYMALSSLSSVLGGLGFFAYTAANHFVDAFAHKRGQSGSVPWISVNWDGWRFSEDEIDDEATGTNRPDLAITSAEGVKAFERILSIGSVPQVVVSTGDLQARIDRWVNLEPVQARGEQITSHVLHARPSVQSRYVEPGDEIERAIVEIWQNLLGIEQVGVQDDFFELGGHSLLATQVISRLRETFKLEIPLRSMFENATVAGLADRIKLVKQKSGQTGLPPIERISRDDNLELSFAQRRLWFIDQITPGNPAYNIPAAVRLEGRLDRDALKRTLDELIKRHEVLRTTFPSPDGRPIQAIAPEKLLTLPIVDLSDLPETQREDEALKLAVKEARRPFDLAGGPLLRAGLLRLSDSNHVLLVTMHHIISDAWSIGVLIQEMGSLYEAFLADEPSPLAELPVQYADFACWQNEWLQGEVLQEQLSYWKQRLSGSPPVIDLPLDHPRHATQRHRGGIKSLVVSESLTSAIKELSRREGATLFMTLLAAFKTLLCRYTRQRDILVGTPIAGRNRVETEALIGLFVNMLVLRSDLSSDPSFVELLSQLRETALGAYAHQDLPFEKLVEELQPERDLSHMPLFQVAFVLQNAPLPSLELPGLTLSSLEVDRGATQFDLILSAVEGDNEQLIASLIYNKDIFEDDTITRMLGHFNLLLESIISNPKQRISAIPILPQSERRRLLEVWGGARSQYPGRSCIHHLFEEQAERWPDRIVVTFEKGSLTYRELNARANQLAHYLKRLGVKSGSLVGICVERSLEMIVGLLGILKSGAAYVPLDPAYPKQRLALILTDAQVSVLLTQQRLVAGLPEHAVRVVCLDSDSSEIAKESAENIFEDLSADTLAYVIFTSGSTGKPKGVMVTHHNVVRLFESTGRLYQFDQDDVWTLFHSYAFDFSVWELWGALLYGGRLVVVPYWLSRSPEDFYNLLGDEGVTVLNQTPSAFRQLIRAESGLSKHKELKLRYVIFGGEALELQSLREWFDRHGDREPQLVNMYGITETTVHVSHRPITLTDVTNASGSVIGGPIDDLEIYILDERLEPVPIGVAGEIYVGGAGIARGYLHRADLTCERFIPNPYGKIAGGRLYKSGDLAKYLPNGDIEYLGRGDLQVKVSGFRIELGEIESALRQHAAVRECAVTTWEDASGHKKLAAYLVTDQNQQLTSGELRGFAQEKLPDYMVPAAFVLLDRFPLTFNGKLDRRALPSPNETRLVSGHDFAMPRTPTEQILASVWAEVLGINPIGIHDNFFELGGDSILSIQIIAGANRAGLQLTPKQLFLHQTIAELAEVAGDLTPTYAEQEAVTGEAPLTPIQQWFFERDIPDPHHFNQAAMLEVRGTVNPVLFYDLIKRLLEHHDALRLRFDQGEFGMRQIQGGLDDYTPFIQVDLSELQDAEQAIAIEAVASWTQSSLDLSAGPLLRVALIGLGSKNGSRLLIAIHHLAVDGVSWRILLDDLSTAYGQMSSGQPVELPLKTTSYKRWAELLSEYSQSSAVKQELDYWSSIPKKTMPRLPVDYPGGDNTEETSDTVWVTLSQEDTRALLQVVPAKYQTQVNDVLLAALAVCFDGWTGSPFLLIDLEGHGREEIIEDIDLSRTVGWFTTIFPVALNLEGISDPGDALKYVKEHLRSIPNRGIGYGLLRYLCNDREVRQQLQSVSRAEVSFNYLGQFDQLLPESLKFGPAQESSGPARNPRAERAHLLEINGYIAGHQLHLGWTYSKSLHRRATIEYLAERLSQSLGSLVSHCQSLDKVVFTPSDFPEAGLSQQELDELITRLSESDKSNIEDIYPLSMTQQGILFHTLYDPGSESYFVQLSCTINGSLNTVALKHAWRRVVDRHPVLRTEFIRDNRHIPLQVVRERAELEWNDYDWRAMPAAEQAENYESLLELDRKRGFELSRAPLMRVHMVRLAEDSHQLIFSHHHLLLDGWSVSLVLKEVFTYYEAFCGGQDLNLSRPRPYREYVSWLKRQDASKAEAYWRKALSGFATTAPSILKRAAPSLLEQKESYEKLLFCISEEKTSSLQLLAQQQHLTLHTILQGVWALILSHNSGQEDVMFGSVMSGRPTGLPGAESMIGLFISTLPACVRVPSDAQLLPWLSELQSEMVELRQFEYSHLVDVHRWSGLSGGVRLFDSNLTFDNYPIDESIKSWGGKLVLSDVRSVDWNGYPISIAAGPGLQLSILVKYDRRFFSMKYAERIGSYFEALLSDAVTYPDATLKQLKNKLAEIDAREFYVKQRSFEEMRRHRMHTPQVKPIVGVKVKGE